MLMLPFLLLGCVFILPAERHAHLCDVGLAQPTWGDSDTDGVADCLDAEECDGLDNDGDGLVDETLFPDDDGDGYGDATVAGPCYVGWVPTPGDCDDDDSAVSPAAAAELCDGKNTRCAADWIEDVDVVTLYPRDPDTFELGEPSDVSEQFLNSSAFTLDDGELLAVCPASAGAYTVTVTTAANATSVGIHGILPDDGCSVATVDALPTLSGANWETPVTLRGSARGTVVDIDCLGITGGGVLGVVGGGLVVGPGVVATVSRSAIWGNSGPWFGGVWNQGDVTLEDVAILDNIVQDAADGDGGGGIRSQGDGALEMYGGRIGGNESPYDGGGATILSGTASFYGTTFGGESGPNIATYRGGGLAVRAGATALLEGVRIDGNAVRYAMGGAMWTAGTVRCREDENGAGEFVDNSADGGVGGIYFAGGILESLACDFSGNTAEDLYVYPIDAITVSLGVDACFECTDAGCVELKC